MLLCECAPFLGIHPDEFGFGLEFGGIVRGCEPVVRTYGLAPVTTVETVSHLFTDIFRQLSAVLYCQI